MADEEIHVIETWMGELEEAVGDLTWDAVPDHRFRVRVATDGRILELTMTAPEDGAISSRALRRLPTAAMGRAVRRHEAARAAADAATLSDRRPVPNGRPDIALMVNREQAWLDGRKKAFGRNGRRGRSALELARIASRYCQLTREVHNPVATLAEELHLSVATTRNLVSRLRREHGLLTDVSNGVAGGELTHAARALLEQEDA